MLPFSNSTMISASSSPWVLSPCARACPSGRRPRRARTFAQSGPGKHPAEEFDRVAAHVHRHAAAAEVRVVEPGGVRPVVLLHLLDKVRLAEGPGVDQLLQPDVLRGEAQLLGVHELHPACAAGVDHAVALGEVHGHGLLDDDVLAGRRRRHDGLAMQIIGQAQARRAGSRAAGTFRDSRQTSVGCRRFSANVRTCSIVGEATASTSASGTWASAS